MALILSFLKQVQKPVFVFFIDVPFIQLSLKLVGLGDIGLSLLKEFLYIILDGDGKFSELAEGLLNPFYLFFADRRRALRPGLKILQELVNLPLYNPALLYQTA